MSDPLADAKWRLAKAFNDHPEIMPAPFAADKWVVNSLLQKSIRRGETDVAQRAALTFLQQGGSAIWRRFMIIAFEDVGVASPEVVAMVVAASADANWRRNVGGNEKVAIHLARMLSNAPKSRSAEHLITTVNCHPSFEDNRRDFDTRSAADNLEMVTVDSSSLTDRGLAARTVSARAWMRGKAGEDDLSGLLEIYLNAGVPTELVEATGIAASRVRDAIVLMVPLLWPEADQPLMMEANVPRALVLDGLPMYALDKHTRIGREAIRDLVKSNYQIRERLNRHIAPARRHDAAYMAAFYADAAPLARKLVWQGSEELERLGTEADLLKVGVAPEGIDALLQVFRDNLDHLNELRAQTFCRTQGFVDVATALVANEEGRA